MGTRQHKKMIHEWKKIYSLRDAVTWLKKVLKYCMGILWSLTVVVSFQIASRSCTKDTGKDFCGLWES